MNTYSTLQKRRRRRYSYNMDIASRYSKQRISDSIASLLSYDTFMHIASRIINCIRTVVLLTVSFYWAIVGITLWFFPLETSYSRRVLKPNYVSSFMITIQQFYIEFDCALFLAKYYHLFVVHCNGNIACNIGPFFNRSLFMSRGLVIYLYSTWPAKSFWQ